MRYDSNQYDLTVNIDGELLLNMMTQWTEHDIVVWLF